MDASAIDLLLGVLFIVVIPVITLVAVEIFEDDDVKKERQLKWHDD
tara:strand:+ start:243 stop:380 length:138 start_codon:yes stop_codon:yes gene_type:complete